MTRKENITKSKAQLINMMCEEARYFFNNKKVEGDYLKCGWVDFVDDDLIQYEIVGVYVGCGRNTDRTNGRICLVHKTGSEGAENGCIISLDQIKSIDTIELILKGLEENYEKVN